MEMEGQVQVCILTSVSGLPVGGLGLGRTLMYLAGAFIFSTTVWTTATCNRGFGFFYAVNAPLQEPQSCVNIVEETISLATCD